MSAGHIVNGSCVDVAASADAFFTLLQPVASAGSPAFYSVVTKTSGGWDLLTYSGSTLVEQTALAVPNFPVCDTSDQFLDGFTVGWAVVAVMVVSWALTVLRRGL
jgi:hypothetical protein